VVPGVHNYYSYGLYCPNNLHRASGGLKKNAPSFWLANKKTKELIKELSTIGKPIVTIEGNGGGTYVCKELVYAYAMRKGNDENSKGVQQMKTMKQILPIQVIENLLTVDKQTPRQMLRDLQTMTEYPDDLATAEDAEDILSNLQWMTGTGEMGITNLEQFLEQHPDEAWSLGLLDIIKIMVEGSEDEEE
jgi:hypothetical protein